MNSAGCTSPRSGECQRASASKRDDPAVAEVDDRLEDDADLVALERALELDARTRAGARTRACISGS